MSIYFRMALKLTKKSTHSKHRMAAVIVKGGAIIAKAANSGAWGKHAESRALKLAKSAKGATIYVARECNKMSRPCEKCMRLIKTVGIKNIVYSDWNKNIISLSL